VNPTRMLAGTVSIVILTPPFKINRTPAAATIYHGTSSLCNRSIVDITELCYAVLRNITVFGDYLKINDLNLPCYGARAQRAMLRRRN
jgi:hypothetical protein